MVTTWNGAIGELGSQRLDLMCYSNFSGRLRAPINHRKRKLIDLWAHLLRGETSIAEHADLLRDVFP